MNVDIVYPEWRDENLHIKFPFSDNALLINTDDQAVPASMFDDARIYPIGGKEDAFLSAVTVTDTEMTFEISDSGTAGIATGIVDLTALPPTDDEYDIGLLDSYGRPAGVLVSSAGRLRNLAGLLGTGVAPFTSTQTPFVASVIIPMPQLGVRGLLLDDGELMTGDVYLVGTDGIVLSVEYGAIRLDAIGDPYALLKKCEEEGVILPAFCGLRTINGIAPDDQGDFKLTVGGNDAPDTVLRMTPREGVLTMKTVGNLGYTNG